MKEPENISKSNPFRVPENYFEDVTGKILAATTEKGFETVKEGLYRRLKPYLAVAASLAVIVLLGFAALRIFSPDNKMPDMPEISFQEFTDACLNDIDVLTLEENLPAVAAFDVITDVSNSEIIDFLMFENINITEIYEIL